MGPLLVLSPSDSSKKIFFAFFQADESKDGPPQKCRIDEAEGGMRPSPVEEIDGAAEEPMEEQRIHQENVKGSIGQV